MFSVRSNLRDLLFSVKVSVYFGEKKKTMIRSKIYVRELVLISWTNMARETDANVIKRMTTLRES